MFFCLFEGVDICIRCKTTFVGVGMEHDERVFVTWFEYDVVECLLVHFWSVKGGDVIG